MKNKSEDFEQIFIDDIKDGLNLLEKELIVLGSQENLLQERIRILKGIKKDLPLKDPQLGVIGIAVDMDLIELDELEARRVDLLERLETIKDFRKQRAASTKEDWEKLRDKLENGVARLKKKLRQFEKANPGLKASVRNLVRK